MTPHRTLRSTEGFALVLTLSLLALLVLLTYAISSVSKIDGEISTASVFQIQAKQNALVALQLAVGKLQVSAGPTDRLTGMAGITGIPVSTDSPTRYWTGVWQADGSLVEWLVSGRAPPSSPTTGYQVLVGDNSVGDQNATRASTSSSREKEWVKVPLDMVSDPTGKITGHIGYWIGDEGLKVSLHIPADESPNPSGVPVVSDKLISTQTAVWNAAEMLSATQRGNLAIYEQMRFAGASAAQVQEAFHFVTLRARWVDGAGYVSGRVNLNTASRPLWYSLVATYNALTAGVKISSEASVARKLADAMTGVGPFAAVMDFENSALLDDSLPSTVTSAAFVQTLDGILEVRSDTFRIRAYGDAINPADAGVSGAIPESVAYCEAIVQRTAKDDSAGHGKKFAITTFRWLGPDDI